jgi:prepilin-type N-terminal cleavage/methylation domain-containing protein
MKLLSLTPTARRRKPAGFTLVEVLAASALGLVAMTALAALTLYTSRSFVAIGNYNDLERASNLALDTLSREVRGAQQLLSFNTNRIELRNAAGQTVAYEYSPALREFARRTATQRTVLLEGCDLLRFNMSQRNPSNDFNFYPASSVAEAKLVDVSWRCSRRVMGQQINTESVQTAKIVIRN